MKKIGSIFMVSVLALAGIGVSFAGFTDAIYVYGTVDTGTVDIDWIGWYSGTWVWKIVFTDIPNDPPGNPVVYDIQNEMLIYRGFVNDYPGQNAIEQWAISNNGTAYFVAHAVAGPGGTQMTLPDGTVVDSDVNMTYDNLFPCIDFCADFVFHYGGSIPAKINVAEIFPFTEDEYDGTGIGFLTWLWNYNQTGYGAWVEAYRAYPLENDTGAIIGWQLGEAVDVGTQLHYCDYVLVRLIIHLPQDNYLQGLSGTFGGIIGVLQWYDCPPRQVIG